MNRKFLLGGIFAATLGVVGVYLHAAGVFVPNDQPVGYVAQPGITSFDLTSNKEFIFRTDFRRSNWSGNLLKVPVTADGTVVEAAEDWNGAASHLDAQNFDTGRKIATLRSDGSKIAFRWANLSTTQQAAIGDSTRGPSILNYVRGQRTNEAPSGLGFRARSSVLGPLIHSTPRYYEYATYARVFVGGNDGMLHVFDADVGDEVFAYVPSMLIPNLNKLVVSPYTLQHYVDGNFAIERVTIGTTASRVLAGGLGAGGRGLYALDVTTANPASEAAVAAMILWEKTNTDTGFDNLGYTYGTPRIGRVKTGAGTSIDAVIVNSGYASTTGIASLFIINAATGALIREISTGSGTSVAPNGLSSVRSIDKDGDGTIDLVFAGDLDGQVWKFDLSAASSASWTATRIFTTSPAQAITTAPSVQPHPNGGYMVLFATGRALTAADITDATVHYAYGVWDSAPAANTSVLTQTLTEKVYSNGGAGIRVRTSTATAPNWASGGHRGWKTPLPGGERVLGDGTFFEGGRYYFTSTNPTITAANGVKGENWLNQLDYLSGGSPGEPFFNLNGDATVDDADRTSNSGTLDLTTAGVPVSKIIDPGLASQPVLASLAVLDTTLFTFNPDVLIPPATADRGVSGGHFDVDIYYSACAAGNNKCWIIANQKHFHEYDDIFNVTGVNFLNASSDTLNLVNAIPSTTTKFKVLAYNQYHSPAVKLTIADAPYVDIRNYGGLTTSGFNITNLPIHDRLQLEGIGSPKKLGFMFNLPLDAFASKDWAGDGNVRAGLIPTQTGCVNKALNAGPLGEPRNGAMTWQVVKSDTPQSALTMNVAGRPDLGWRVQDNLMTTWVLAEYTLFWHHPNGKCTRDAGWTDEPPQDTSPPDASKFQTKAAGSADPADGDFTTGPGGGTTTVTVNGNVTTIKTTNPDGSTRTETRTANADGTTKVVVTSCPPGASGSSCTTTTTLVPAPKSFTGTGGLQKASQYGRMSWRDVHE